MLVPDDDVVHFHVKSFEVRAFQAIQVRICDEAAVVPLSYKKVRYGLLYYALSLQLYIVEQKF